MQKHTLFSIDALTTQERKILALIANGCKSQNIAEYLFISTHTVKNHKTNICRKLNLSGTTDLFKFALTNEVFLENIEKYK